MNRLLGIAVVTILLLPGATAQITEDHDSSFQMPDWDNQQEMVSEYVAPFIFVYVIMYFALVKTFHFILRDQEPSPWEDGPDPSTESMIIALAVTLMLMVTPYWNFIQAAMKLLGVAGVVAFMAAFFFVIYLMAK